MRQNHDMMWYMNGVSTLTLGERMKKVRKTLDLTQQEFSDKIGSKRNTVATYEIGRTDPSAAVISLICREFNVNETWLRTGEGKMFVEAPSDTLDALAREYHLDRFGRTVVEKMLNLNEKQWAVFHDFAMDVLESLSEDAAGEDIPIPATMDTGGRERQEVDIAAELAELKRQNRELAAKVAAMEKKDDIEAARLRSASAGSFSSAEKKKNKPRHIDGA